MSTWKPSEDAFGQEMLAFQSGHDVQEIIERDDGYIDISNGPKAYFEGYTYWPPHLKRAMRFARGRVLDIGCGAGRHSLYLQKRGFKVLGTDISPLAIRVVRTRGLKQAKATPIDKLNASLGRFDTILMLGNNFGLFGSFNRARWLLRRFKRFTSDSARIIAESLDPYQTDAPVHLTYHRRNRSKGRMSGQVRIRVRFHDIKSPWFDYLMVSKKEMEDILSGTGWIVRRYLDSYGPTYVAIIERD